MRRERKGNTKERDNSKTRKRIDENASRTTTIAKKRRGIRPKLLRLKSRNINYTSPALSTEAACCMHTRRPAMAVHTQAILVSQPVPLGVGREQVAGRQVTGHFGHAQKMKYIRRCETPTLTTGMDFSRHHFHGNVYPAPVIPESRIEKPSLPFPQVVTTISPGVDK